MERVWFLALLRGKHFQSHQGICICVCICIHLAMNCPSQTSALPQNSLTAPTSQLSHLRTTRHLHFSMFFSSDHLRPDGDGGGGQVLGQPPQLLPLHLGGLVHPAGHPLHPLCAGHPLQHPASQRSAAVAHFHREFDSTGSTVAEGYLIVTHYQLFKLYCNSFSLFSVFPQSLVQSYHSNRMPQDIFPPNNCFNFPATTSVEPSH